MHDYTRCAYPVRLALENAPADDEPDDDDFDGGLSEARADMQAERTTSTVKAAVRSAFSVDVATGKVMWESAAIPHLQDSPRQARQHGRSARQKRGDLRRTPSRGRRSRCRCSAVAVLFAGVKQRFAQIDRL